jgi:hypothetical protein
MRFTGKVEWQQENGTLATADLGRIDSDGLHSATDLGLKCGYEADSRATAEHCHEDPGAQLLRVSPKLSFVPGTTKGWDHREKRLDSICGTAVLRSPRFERCRACDCIGTYSPLSKLLPERVLPELCHLHAELSAELPYSRAAAIMQKFLPATGGLSAMTTRNRTLVVGKRMEGEVDCPRL